jgi:hypothetical protein
MTLFGEVRDSLDKQFPFLAIAFEEGGKLCAIPVQAVSAKRSEEGLAARGVKVFPAPCRA